MTYEFSVNEKSSRRISKVKILAPANESVEKISDALRKYLSQSGLL